MYLAHSQTAETEISGRLQQIKPNNGNIFDHPSRVTIPHRLVSGHRVVPYGCRFGTSSTKYACSLWDPSHLAYQGPPSISCSARCRRRGMMGSRCETAPSLSFVIFFGIYGYWFSCAYASLLCVPHCTTVIIVLLLGVTGPTMVLSTTPLGPCSPAAVMTTTSDVCPLVSQ